MKEFFQNIAHFQRRLKEIGVSTHHRRRLLPDLLGTGVAHIINFENEKADALDKYLVSLGFHTEIKRLTGVMVGSSDIYIELYR
jgi:hypothetical protein